MILIATFSEISAAEYFVGVVVPAESGVSDYFAYVSERYGGSRQASASAGPWVAVAVVFSTSQRLLRPLSL